MLKKSIALQSTTVENELSFLLSLLQDAKKPFRESITPHDSTEYPDGIARMVRAVRQAGWPNRIQNKIVIREESYTSIIPSLKDGTGEEVLTPGAVSVDALIVTAWQRPQNSVLLEFEYLEHWQQLVISLIQSIRPPIEQEDGNAQLAKEMRIARQRASLENRLGLAGYTLFPESISFAKSTEATKPEPPDRIMPINATKQEQLGQNNQPRVPKRKKELNDWRLRWHFIGEKWNNGYFETYQACIEFLEAKHKRLACKEDVLADTIAAGNAGLLNFPETS